MSSTTPSPPVTLNYLRFFLLESSTYNRFFIEYGGFLSNHLAHAAVALYKLGDTQEHFCKYSSVVQYTTT